MVTEDRLNEIRGRVTLEIEGMLIEVWPPGNTLPAHLSSRIVSRVLAEVGLTCLVPYCLSPHRAHGLCARHYQRAYKRERRAEEKARKEGGSDGGKLG